ncbi:MAG: cytidylate kinase-like family protein [Deltaproteobacteria bacterium]|nr:cytidylate kinase-like family protein [Deltaproteobacteria bacterium]
MKVYIGDAKYMPGAYAKSRPSAAELADRYIREWDEKRLAEKETPPVVYPTICFSRKIGVGALEVADILGDMIGYRVVDRGILEYIAEEADLGEKTVALFDERYPGKLSEFWAMAFGEKSFIESDYSRHLFKAVYAIASLGPTIFVGRGTHLLLPRDRVLAVRFVSSDEHRIKRIAEILQVETSAVESKLDHMDKEQRDFFKRVYGKKDAPLEEFDLGVNLECITGSKGAAEIVALAFRQKFDEAATLSA